MNLKLGVLLLAFIWVEPARPSGVLESFGSKCPYKDLANKKSTCLLAPLERTNLQNSFNIARATCLVKNKNPICQSLKQKYPFLIDHENHCEASSLCSFPGITNWPQALQSCHQGEIRAAKELGAQIQDVEDKAEVILNNFQEEVGEIISEQTRLVWTALKSCLFDKNVCSPNQILDDIKNLPEGLREQLLELIEASSSLDCLEEEARIELLCYLRATHAIHLAKFAAIGGAFAKGGQTLYRAMKELNNLKKTAAIAEKSDRKIPIIAPSQPLTGRFKLEKNLGTPVVFETLPGKITSAPSPLFTVYSKSKTRLGDMKVTYETQTQTLHIDTMYTEMPYRKKGVGEALLEKALQEFPDTQVISVKELTQTNKERVQSVLNKKTTDRSQQYEELENAIKESPAYKIRSHLGFCEIIPHSIDQQTLGFKVRCPSPD